VPGRSRSRRGRGRCARALCAARGCWLPRAVRGDTRRPASVLCEGRLSGECAGRAGKTRWGPRTAPRAGVAEDGQSNTRTSDAALSAPRYLNVLKGPATTPQRGESSAVHSVSLQHQIAWHSVCMQTHAHQMASSAAERAVEATVSKQSGAPHAHTSQFAPHRQSGAPPSAACRCRPRTSQALC